MLIRCAWCGKDLGEKLPYEDTDISHGICEACRKTVMAEEPSMTLGEIEEETQPAQEAEKPREQTDEELYESCEECHVAVSASMVADICAANPEEAGSCELISRGLENENTEPAEWIKAMIQAAEEATGGAKEEMVAAVVELMDYLKSRNSPFLQTLDDPLGKGQP